MGRFASQTLKGATHRHGSVPNGSLIFLSVRSPEALKKEERFRTLAESSPIAVLLTAVDGTITLLNKQAQVMFGYAFSELAGNSVEIPVPEGFRKHHPSHRAQFDAEPR
jgi:PAS domain-containing protein